MEYKQISHQLNGMWADIYSHYGIELPAFKGKNTKNGPCVLCGGTDRAHWRSEGGRIALYCRGCCPESMKSPEAVIMEYTGISFPELVNDLKTFLGMETPAKREVRVKKVNSEPDRNMPCGHKQNHEKSMAFIESCKMSDFVDAFVSLHIQHPYDLPVRGKVPCFPIINSKGSVINVASYKNGIVGFLAGGVSYGGYHEIKGRCNCGSEPHLEDCKVNTVIYCTEIILAMHLHYRKCVTVRCVFDIYNLIWMRNNNMIDGEVELNKNELELYDNGE